jgi:aminomethyltransferase
MTTPIQSADTPSQNSSATTAQLAALLGGVAFSPLDEIGWLRITGSDRVRWLNGMVTNSITKLATGQGCYNFALNAQGQIQGDLTAFLEPDSILIESGSAAKLATLLERFIIMDEVELADISMAGDADNRRVGLLLAGPQAVAILHKLNIQIPNHTPTRFQTVLRHTSPLEIVHARSVLVPRFEFWSTPTIIGALTEELLAAGAIAASTEAVEQLRILEGTPRYGIDITDRTLPQETTANGTQSHALGVDKGCYVGQEIVERIRARGNVHRALSGFLLAGTLPVGGTALEVEGEVVGEVTSVASIQLPGQLTPIQLALGVIRRESLKLSFPITYAGGSATPVVVPYAIA